MRILVLFAIAAGSTAIEVDLSYLETVSSDLHDHLVSGLRSLLKEHARPEIALPQLKNHTTCKPCVQEGTKFLVHSTVSKMQDTCAKISANNSDPRSCMAMKVCGMMSKHPKVMLGMMIEHVRPMSLSTAYCVGKGACEKPDSVTMDEIVMGNEPHEALLENFDKIDWTEVEEQTQELLPFEKDDEVAESVAPKCEEQKKHMKVCPKCMKKAMRHVMHHSVVKVKEMCAHVDQIKCPVMKKMCPWMAQNKAVSLGMLIGKVEPWKFAFGFCLAKKKDHGRWPHLPWHHGQSWHRAKADVLV